MHNNSSIWLGMKRLENTPLLINTQHYTLFQIAISRLLRPYQDCLPSVSYTCAVDRSLSGIQAKLKVCRCACKSCNLEIARVCYTISRLRGTYANVLACVLIRESVDSLYVGMAPTRNIYSTSLIPRLSVGGERESLVSTVCACA